MADSGEWLLPRFNCSFASWSLMDSMERGIHQLQGAGRKRDNSYSMRLTDVPFHVHALEDGSKESERRGFYIVQTRMRQWTPSNLAGLEPVSDLSHEQSVE